MCDGVGEEAGDAHGLGVHVVDGGGGGEEGFRCSGGGGGRGMKEVGGESPEFGVGTVGIGEEGGVGAMQSDDVDGGEVGDEEVGDEGGKVGRVGHCWGGWSWVSWVVLIDGMGCLLLLGCYSQAKDYLRR